MLLFIFPETFFDILILPFSLVLFYDTVCSCVCLLLVYVDTACADQGVSCHA